MRVGRRTTLDFFVVLTGCRDIVAASSELKFRDRRWNRFITLKSVINNVFSRLCGNGHIPCVQCERETVYFESIPSADFFITHCKKLLLLFLSGGGRGGGGYQGKNRVALTNVVINVGYQYYCFENFFSKFVFSEFIFKFISYKSRSFSSDYFYFAKITAFI